jgi:hypothetical protein
MINNAWSGEVSQHWLSLTHLKTARSIMIHENNIGDMTEEVLSSHYDNMLSDKDIMLAFKVLCKYRT